MSKRNQRIDIDAEIEKVEDLIDIVKLSNDFSIMVDGKLVISGRVAKMGGTCQTLPIDIYSILKMVPGVSHQEPFYITISKYSIAALLFT